jgi:hypothetical protein
MVARVGIEPTTRGFSEALMLHLSGPESTKSASCDRAAPLSLLFDNGA